GPIAPARPSPIATIRSPSTRTSAAWDPSAVTTVPFAISVRIRSPPRSCAPRLDGPRPDLRSPGDPETERPVHPRRATRIVGVHVEARFVGADVAQRAETPRNQ